MRYRLLTFLVAGGILTGCAHTIPLKPTLDRPPAVQQTPLAVGVYWSPEFTEFEHSGSRYGDTWIFKLGEPSRRLFEAALGMLFEAVVPVSTRPPLAEPAPRVAAVLAPAIEEFDFGLPFLKTGTYTAGITYRFTLDSPRGERLGSWTVRGEGAKRGQVGFEFARWPGEAADLAMQDAARRFLDDFRNVPEVARWLQASGVRMAAAPPAPLPPPPPPAAAPPPPGAPPPAAAAPPVAAVRSLAGEWTGTLTFPRETTSTTAAEHAVRLRLVEGPGGLRWTLEGLDTAVELMGSGAGASSPDAVTLAGTYTRRRLLTGLGEFAVDGPTRVEFSLSRYGGVLEGSGTTADNRVLKLVLRRAR